MIKKISAIILALVICLSVVVVPASALSGDAIVSFKVELDKETYSSGDTVTVSIYMEVADGYEWEGGVIYIGCNSSLFDTTVNAPDTVKETATLSDLYSTYYKDPAGITWAWEATATKLNNIKTNNTAEENAMFDQYLKVPLTKDSAGTHDNSKSTMNGLTSEEINGQTEPCYTFQLTLNDEIDDGTVINMGVPSGAIAKKYSYFRYYANPGVKTTKSYPDVSKGYENINSTTSTIGAASIITDGKDGIRFEKDADGTYANMVSVRTKAQIAANEIQSRLGNITDNDAVEDKILEAGFVYIADANGTLNATTAQTVAKTKADGESVDSHIKKSVSYIQYDGTNYSFTCLVDEIAHANIATADFNAYAYIVLDIDGDGVADDDEWFFAAAGNDASPSELYTAHSAAAWEAYGWGTAPAL